MPKEPLRVLIADDHPLFRSGMRALLAADLDTEVVGEATTGEEAIEMAATLQPDVILMDLQMPGMSGIEATRSILHTSPHIRILVVTMYEDDHSVFTAMRAGARGYLLKGASPDEVLRAMVAGQRRSHLQPIHRHAPDRFLREPATNGIAPGVARIDRART
jgi:DNA-binding NarL/FixJ family response regulator